MQVLVVNAGSSSLRLRVLGPTDEAVAAANVRLEGNDTPAPEIESFVAEVAGVDAVGHRVVHGGPDLRRATVVDDAVLERIEAQAPLAPLHQARAVAGIRALRAVWPDIPAVACFDTAFHATLPAAAATYALPRQWRESWGLTRYGFHGLSHAYAVRRAAEVVGRELDGLRVVSCHLGAGSSLCATIGGRSVDTTMGFTPLEGLVMATRSGSVDPGLVLWLLRRAGLSADEVAEGLERASGLAGLAGGTGDVRHVVAAAGEDEAAASTACAGRWRPWPRPPTVWTCSCSPGASVSTSRWSAPPPPRAWPSWASTSIDDATRPPRATPTSAPMAPIPAPWSSPPART
jgi:acetate kinase